MARPRVVKLAEGTVSLQSVPKEQADKIIALLSGVQAESEVAPTEVEHDAAPVDASNLTGIAIGLNKNKAGTWELVSVKFNSETKEAQVSEVEDFGGTKAIAVSEFKIKASDHFNF